MGVDIYGLKPKLSSTQPAFPDNYEDLSEEQKSDYWNQRNQWEQENPGYYFRNNWWHWRPIQVLIGYFNDEHSIGIPEEELRCLGSNDGVGVSDPAQCEQLAACFKSLIEDMRRDEKRTVYLNTGWWYCKIVGADGKIMTERVQNEKILEELNEKYKAVFFEEADLNGVGYEPSHGTNLDNLQEFALFLENCNGFKIH